MMPSSNTPPHGDFVSYLERLTAVKVPPEPKAMLRASGPVVKADAPGFAGDGFGPFKVGLGPLTKVAFMRHVRWVVGIWAAVKVLAWLVPGARYLLVPLLVLYAAWVMFSLKPNAPSAFPGRLRRLAGRIAEPLAKAQNNNSSHQP